MLEIWLGLITNGAGYLASPALSVSTCLAELCSVSNWTNLAEANSAKEGSTPLSNLREASEESLWRREFCAIATGLNRTASSAISVVF